MIKKYLKLTQKQKARGVIFSSQLMPDKSNNTIKEVFSTDSDNAKIEHINNLKDDSFFNGSIWDYNLIRR